MWSVDGVCTGLPNSNWVFSVAIIKELFGIYGLVKIKLVECYMLKQVRMVGGRLSGWSVWLAGFFG